MADRVESMSDAELRTKLAEHGFPVMPITASTRKLLVKKLKLVLDKGETRNGSAATDSRRSLARYSSGEDSDMDVDSGKQKRGRRVTTGGAMPPPTAARARRSTPKKDSPAKKVEEERGSESEEETRSPIKTHEEVETVTTRRITRMYNPDEYETGSDSDVDVDKKASPFRSDSRSSDYISSTLPALDEPRIGAANNSFFSSRPGASAGYTSPLSGTERLDSIRSRLGLSSSFADRPSLGARPSSVYIPSRTLKSAVGTDEVESPNLTSFAKRLSTLASEPMRAMPVERDGGSSSYLRKPYITSASRGDTDYRAADKKFLRSNAVSLALVVIVALFFFFLFSVYLVRKNDMSAIVDDNNVVIPYCQLNIPGNRPGINCVPKDQVSYAKNLLKRLQPELSSRAAAFMCGKPGASPFLSEEDVIELASKSALLHDRSQIRTDLYNLQVLLVNNPQWGVSVVEMKGVYSRGSEHTVLKSMEDIATYRSKGNMALMITDPSTPISCLLTNTLYSAGTTIVIAAAILAGGYFSHRGWKVYQAYKKRKNEEIYSMVEQILDVISQKCEDNGEAYVSVSHVRDMLIAPQNRNAMSSVWEAAIAFITKNESRVRMEVQSVNGEDCQVWRWVSPRGSPRAGGPAAWQGQAFEIQEGSVNNLSVSPTQCLKIRHMFDKGENGSELRIVIQDAILEKVGEQCNILHIDLDRATCCVYVKCASPKDAGMVYKSLHGWWYKGKLITVKYLRLERYMVRFPNSPSIGPYLKHSRMRNMWN